ncbi:hypothetical protein PA905_35200 [Planktothrix agardhii CCAP 1459/11A]|jgi:hypothetical protein|uniref:Uncharacterized protein n=1 Tax=Planktothrix agardhii CCAP 1459/11A TaxID=282420 RepID=A0A4P5ZGI2_PLAAG|nr:MULTISPECIES: hypothetical protein [Planktothrix]CAD5940045.1 hypothetical protein NO108_02237 [Planktothrix rubescens]MCF3570195.1 hypothetical protein [Planktothrix agardhii 1805]MCF3586756.1 hypothetical protein [Planktothrix agardhii 1803]MCF3603621.1 hypothetical protein [Planktothrix agardhii 1804]MCF3615470.1 hypothetical protein [Planktothrix agardhii 1806]
MINLTLGQILRQFSLILISLGLIIACNSIFAPDKKNSNILKVATDHGCLPFQFQENQVLPKN